MKTMQKLGGIFLLLMLLATGVSCSDDDDKEGTRITYKLDSDSPMVTSIVYADANEDLVTVNNVNKDFVKTQYIIEPYVASITVFFNNTTNVASKYTLSIYVDDLPVQIDESEVPGNSGSYTATISHDLDL